MDVILTHEQADFDALAAELGAYLMNENAFAVTSRKMNRNVRAFLTLYGNELPFIEAGDLPPGPIDTITLVDTQSMVTLKGMSQRTRVQVVDHHTLRPDLPAHWDVSIEPVGSCTTLFVEGLSERDGSMDSIYATLLLLGIYEDTGSLTYASTTPRDIRAAAFLLERGASLKILTQYLNPPLTDEQRRVYDRLLSSAERQEIYGQTILVARANAEDLSDEISTIAHKLRDLLDPDALILVVSTIEGIRIVARSVTDTINVSKIAERFGGGGHGRAAAALVRVSESADSQGISIKTPTLEEVYQDLLSILPENVRPSMVVRQIMSPRPLVLAPDTPAEKAAFLMRRYGYEGYPIVENGKVRGLLTRRAVDRAISHKLNLPASSLMDSGEVTVHPGDSIEHLRRIMIESGWGQIPVIDPENETIVGIVTRTDLLKTAQYAPTSERQNLAGRLEVALSPTRLALLKAVAAKAYEQHLAVYIVGGFVRDLLIGHPSPDFDLVVEGDAIALAGSLAEEYGGRLVSHRRFGTSKWTISDIHDSLTTAFAQSSSLEPSDLPESLDLISARTEFYDYPTALPTVERSSIKLDLHRRDFTINTMALRLDGRHYGELYDYWGGLRDLNRGLVRVLHSLSFVDDPTRMMRAVRFEQRFGYKIEERTLQLIAEAHPLVRQVSGDRLRHEILLMLGENKAMAMLQRLQELELLSAIHPCLTWTGAYQTWMERALYNEIPVVWKLPEKLGGLPIRYSLSLLAWFFQYPIGDGLSIIQRLRLSSETGAVLSSAKKLSDDLAGLVGKQPSQITERLESDPSSALYLLNLFDLPDEMRAVLHQYVQSWRDLWPKSDGYVLRQMNIPPGPQYRLILKTLRSAWLDGKITSETQENQLLDELIHQLPDLSPEGK